MTDKLIYVDADGKVSPSIAERWEQNGDATEFTLHLKGGITFSDGTPLDASAVVANLDIWYAGHIKEGHQPSWPLSENLRPRRGGRRDHRKVIIDLIGATTTETGLKVVCELDTNTYPKEIVVSDAEMDAIHIVRADFRGEWNYTIKPNPV